MTWPGRGCTGTGAGILQHEVSEVAQSCLTLCDPMDFSLSGCSIHGIFQARTLEWVAMKPPINEATVSVSMC